MIFHRGWEGVIKNRPLKKEKRNWLNGLPICSVGLELTLQTVFVGLGLEFKTDLSMVLFACFLVNKALRRTMVQIPLTLIHVIIGGFECRRGDGGWMGHRKFLLDCVLSLGFRDTDTLRAYLKVPLVSQVIHY